MRTHTCVRACVCVCVCVCAGIPSLKQGALINANIDGVDQRLVTIVLINGSKKPVDQQYCHQPLINSLIFCVDQHIEICC